MNKKLLLSISALSFVGLIGLAVNSALAYRGDYSQKGPNYTPERHEAMVKALENNDYNAWKELMAGRGRVTQLINEQNFSRFAESRRLALEGKTEEANKIRMELGLGQGLKKRFHSEQRQGYGRMAR